ncbi:putative Toprim domain-containing protein [Burkholderia multivorans]
MHLTDYAVIDQFVAAMRDKDIDVNPADVVPDGQLHRIHVEGDARDKLNGWYVLHADEHPAGKFGCNKRYGKDVQFPWKAKQQHAEPLTDAERRELRERREAQRREREEADTKRHAIAAELANRFWNAATDAVESEHPYLARKGIKSHGLRKGAWEKFDPKTGTFKVVDKNALLVPIRDAQGSIHSLQAIFPDADNRLGRDKDYLANGDKHGRYYQIGEPLTVNNKPVILICEGYATGASLRECTEHAVIVAFDASNLLPVAQEIRNGYPTATIVMCADNDQWTTAPINNPGVRKAREAAKAIGGRVAFPPFTDADGRDEDGKRKGPTDFNDLADLRGADAVRDAINSALLEDAASDAQFYLAALEAIKPELKGPEENWLRSMQRAEDPMTAAAWSWAIMGRIFRAAPPRFDVDDMLTMAASNAPPCGFPPGFIAAAKELMERRLYARRRDALAVVSFSRAAITRHHYTRCTALPILTPEDFARGGVILIRAPKGTGKTESIMKPFALWAGKRGGFVAIVHRVSLVQELARRLECKLYSETTAQFARDNAVPAFATCLPSIVKNKHKGIIVQCDYLAIDEIAQVLAFIESDTACKAEGVKNVGVYAALCDMVRRARCIIGADAGLNDQVIRFLESCRPGERFRIYDMADSDQGMRAEIMWGDAGKSTMLGEMQARLIAGQNIWIACDTKKDADAIAKILATCTDRPILCITSDRTAERERFMADPEGVSCEYAAVIHSPAISSGISIKHDHFSHGFLIYSGCTIPPAEASQMMRRVRPLKNWTVSLSVSRASATPDAEAMLMGMERASEIAGTPMRASDFDAFIADIRAQQARARIDGAAGLYWLLEAERYTVTRTHTELDALAQEAYKRARSELNAEARAAILAAPDLTDEEAHALRRQSVKTADDEAALKRYTIARELGVRAVDEAALDVWTKIGPTALDRFASAMLGYAGNAEHGEGEHLSQRSPHAARRAVYARLLDGIGQPGMEITNELAELMISRFEAHRFACSWLDMLPAKWGIVAHDKKGNELPFKRPAYPRKEVCELFRRLGMTIRQGKSKGKERYFLPDDFSTRTCQEFRVLRPVKGFS